ncbi:MAG: transporter gliding motility auxiliary component [Gammaproteobacteria bacterium]|nr:transporter gliding motility auxiliary component [Gammaproteobacteria bacterium]
MTKRSTLGGGTLLALALLFVGLTVLFNYALRGWRLDLTQNHLYTTAPGTDRILKGIKEPINLYFFFSEKTADQIPQLKSYGTRVREFLEELQTRSGGNVHLHVVDPQPFSEEEDRATELGVKSAPVGATGSQFFFGLAGTNSTDGHAAIEFFDPAKEQFLEYDVVKLIYTLANPKKPVVAWLSTIPMGESLDQRSGQVRPAWAIYSQAQQLFDVREVEASTNKIDPDVSTLVIVHPKGLSPATQWAIDQYALRGGHILLFVDPLAESDPAGQGDPSNPMAAMGADKSSHFNTLLADWGVSFDPKEVVADRARALSVSMHQGEPPQQHLGILGLDSSSFNASDVVTAGLSNVNVATAGFLTPIKGATTKFESILQSSTEAQPMPAQRFAMLFDPSSLREGFKPTGQRYTIAARVTGNVKTMFPSGPPTGVTLPPGQAALKESVKPLNLIVFADTDLLSDFMWVHQQNFFGQQVAQAWASNGDLILNSLDNLSGSTDLISVRGRATFTRPFERVERLRHVADDRFHAEEQQLEQKLHETEEKLESLQSKRSDKSAIILTPEQEKELDRFQEEKVSIRKQLRQVRAGLDAEIKGLGNELKILNIVVVPFLFAVVVLLIAVGRRRQRTSSAINKENNP